MSCKFCNGNNALVGSDGWFLVSSHTLRKRDGSVEVQPIIRYTISGEIFGTEVEVDDHAVIRYCPMCGGEL